MNKTALLLFLITFAGTRLLSENLTTTRGVVYTNIKLAKTAPDSIVIEHDHGVAKIRIEDLTPEQQKKYNLNQISAKQFRESKDSAALQSGRALHFKNGALPYMNSVKRIAVMPDKRIALAGSMELEGKDKEFPEEFILMLTENGEIDNSFKKLYPRPRRIESLMVQADGKLVIGGSYLGSNQAEEPTLVRLLPNGSQDESFQLPRDLDLGPVTCIVQDKNGKVLVGHGCGYYDSAAKTTGRLVRLNSDGSLDLNFSSTTQGSIDAVAIDADGKILIGGRFESVSGYGRSSIARLMADGKPDDSFKKPYSDLIYVKSIALQKDNKILISGYFAANEPMPVRMVARLDQNGTPDTSFMKGTEGPRGGGVEGLVNALAVGNDGSILIGGGFQKVNGVLRPKAALLNSDGLLVESFLKDYGEWSGSVEAAVFLDANTILIGGRLGTVKHKSGAEYAFGALWCIGNPSTSK